MKRKRKRPPSGRRPQFEFAAGACDNGGNLTAAPADCQTWEQHRADPRPVETWSVRRARNQ